jgi:hypothetical protein
MTAPTIPADPAPIASPDLVAAPVVQRPAPAPGPAARPVTAGRLGRWRRLLRRPRANPILRRELRVRMRGRRAFVVLGVYLLLLGLVTYATQQVLIHADNTYQLQSFQVGQILFAGLALFEITLLIFVAPALTATAISTERERGTFDLLRATPIRAHTIVWGKLVAALGYAALLIVAAIPIASAVFLFGGVAPTDVWATFALLGVTTLAFGMLGLFCSALARRTGLAAVLAYVTAAGLVVGTVGLYVFLDAVDGGLVDSQQFFPGPDGGFVQVEGDVVVAEVGMAASDGVVSAGQDEPPRLLLALNPLLAMANLVGDAVDESPADPWTGRQAGIPVFGDWLEFIRPGNVNQVIFDGMGRPVVPEPVDEEPLWHLTVAVYGGATVVLFLATVWLVARSTGHRWRLPRPRLRLRRRRAASVPAAAST